MTAADADCSIFLVGEGVVHAADDVAGIRYCAGATADGGNTYNVVDVALAQGVAAPDASLERNLHTTSSCGLCGKAGLDAVRTSAAWSVAEDRLRIGPEVLAALPDRLRAAQRVFDSTGGLHAAGYVLLTGAVQVRQVLDELSAEARLRPSPRVESDSVAALFAHVRTGRWAGMVPRTWPHVFGVPHGMRAVPLVEPTRTGRPDR